MMGHGGREGVAIVVSDDVYIEKVWREGVRSCEKVEV